MVDTTINYNPNTVSIQETKLYNDENYEILSVRKAAEIFSSVSKGNIDKDLKKNKVSSCNDDKEKSGLYDFFYPTFFFLFIFFPPLFN